jgi:predicted anti-sigma-YlaC factor YlaD
MNTDPVNSDSHERARLMIALFGPDTRSPEGFSGTGLSPDEQTWLVDHLESCPPCRRFRENVSEKIRSLRGVPITASAGLVSRTQMRVRQRATELQRQQERLWVVCVCCAAVTLSTVVTTAVLWRGFEWMAQQARIAAPVWEGGFLVFYLMPAVLAGILLLAQGTFLADHNGSYPDDRGAV